MIPLHRLKLKTGGTHDLISKNCNIATLFVSLFLKEYSLFLLQDYDLWDLKA